MTPGSVTYFGSKYEVKGDKPALLRVQAKLLSLSDDSADIKDMRDGERVVFRLKGSCLSPVRNKVVLSDAEGNMLFGMRANIMQFWNRQSVCSMDAEGHLAEHSMYRIVSGFGNRYQRTKKLVNQKTGEEIVLKMYMKWWRG